MDHVHTSAREPLVDHTACMAQTGTFWRRWRDTSLLADSVNELDFLSNMPAVARNSHLRMIVNNTTAFALLATVAACAGDVRDSDLASANSLATEPIASTSLALTTATVDQPIASPMFVNLYWDTTWDLDNPSLTKETIDQVTQAVIGSSYLNALSEYGVTSISFGGGFLPAANCPSVAPQSVGFYDPLNTSLSGFIQCEHDHGPAILQQPNVIYNVILPPSCMESDAFSQNFCTGAGSPAAWHYHGLEDSFPPFNGLPVYTIALSNTSCLATPSALFLNLFHEMVEAATDPFPIDISIIPPQIDLSFNDEIADICEGTTTNLWVNGVGDVILPTYWSNARQLCNKLCGDGACAGGETCSSCPADCGVCPPICTQGATRACCPYNQGCSEFGKETCNGSGSAWGACEGAVPPIVCTPNTTQKCCPYTQGCSCLGSQQCNANGTEWGACRDASPKGRACN